MFINRMIIAVMAAVSFIVAKDQLLHPKLSVAILAQNGVYAYFSIIFVPILLGIFYPGTPAKIPFSASILAALTHFSVYYLLPFFHRELGWSFGWFGKYLEGSVRNPAIAASTAILLSLTFTFVAIEWHKVFPKPHKSKVL